MLGPAAGQGIPWTSPHCKDFQFHLEGEMQRKRSCFWFFSFPQAGVTKEGRTSKAHFWPHEHQSSVDRHPSGGSWIPSCASGRAGPCDTIPKMSPELKGTEQGHPETASPASPSASSPTEVSLKWIYGPKCWKTWKGILWSFNLSWIQRL